jgi:mRNA-degrading endonuclease YafQ of YafQ-DinJ toxin-antitoxin module
MEVSFTRAFLKRLNKYEETFREGVFEKIEEFKDPRNHEHLKVHKLHGKFSKFYSFSINYKTRIVFEYVSKTEVALLSIGDHDIYI